MAKGDSPNGICGLGSADVTDGSSMPRLELQQDLDQPDDAGARFQMADVRLDHRIRHRASSRTSGSWSSPFE